MVKDASTVEQDTKIDRRRFSSDTMKYWEAIADKISASGWSWGCSSQIDSTGRVLFTADAHRDEGKRFIVTADEKLTAFFELERQLSKAAGMIKAGY
jgi:hypothetical protein